MSKGRIRPANKQFYTNNDYELTLGNETTIEEVERERERESFISYTMFCLVF